MHPGMVHERAPGLDQPPPAWRYPDRAGPPQPRSQQWPPQAGPRLSQSQTDSHYILDIDGVEPATVQVDVVGGSLVVQIARQASIQREKQFPDGHGLVRSYQWSSGSRSRRLPLPWDADPDALERQDLAAPDQDSVPELDQTAQPWPQAAPPNWIRSGVPTGRVRVLIPRRTPAPADATRAQPGRSQP
ncbi:MAG: Hsp20/alpha crystallin family protein [Chromatiaceae bacterium]|nr:MAG: Hsp20/alpha crystallin family protein [Chromatiaceae bacterium]